MSRFDSHNGFGNALTIAALVAAGIGGLVATCYGLVVAYLAGSESQAQIDGCKPADPRDLAHVSMAQLADIAQGNRPSYDVITIDESDIKVTD